MKVSILLAAGTLSALAVMASGQAQPPPLSDLASRNSAGSPQEFARTRDVAPPVPRGDLRGDIASNARARPDNEREERSRHH